MYSATDLTMNYSRLYYCPLSILVLALGLTAPTVGWAADELNEAIDIKAKTTAATAGSQNKIDQLSDQTRNMLEEYRQNIREAESLKKYNDHLSQMVESQAKERQSLSNQLREIEITKREIVPLMVRMLDSLEAFVGFDLPFLPAERQGRLEELNEMMVRADVTTVEKFRRVLEAYQIENDFGRTIEAYRADLKQGDSVRPVDFLRLGRVALFYQTLDGGETGIWNAEEKKWETLAGKYTKPVRSGLRIARKEAAPDLLTLPVPAPEAVQ